MGEIHGPYIDLNDHYEQEEERSQHLCFYGTFFKKSRTLNTTQILFTVYFAYLKFQGLLFSFRRRNTTNGRKIVNWNQDHNACPQKMGSGAKKVLFFDNAQKLLLINFLTQRGKSRLDCWRTTKI